jgi:hypothetical protein
MRRDAWTRKAIGYGQFLKPKPLERLNKLRVSSHGQLVMVRF